MNEESIPENYVYKQKGMVVLVKLKFFLLTESQFIAEPKTRFFNQLSYYDTNGSI